MLGVDDGDANWLKSHLTVAAAAGVIDSAVVDYSLPHCFRRKPN